jgi:general secretion pathway protein G
MKCRSHFAVPVAPPSCAHALGAKGRNARRRGFTLIEMIVVVSIVLVLLAISLPMYNRSITRAKEAKFQNNLSTLNSVIQRYSEDKRMAPQQLDDLVQQGYLKEIPDDITGSNTTWVPENETDPEKAWNPDQMGISGVKSGSSETSPIDGRPYSEWK